jgi:cell division protein FtsI/penicillin-binding protein 2
MFVARRTPGRRVLVIGAGAIVAGAIYLGGGDAPGHEAAARIGGAPLEPSRAPASEIAAFANLATQPAAKPKTVVATTGAPLIDLDKITRDGDQYVSVLPDGRRAVLTLDAKLQRLAEKLLDESRAPRGAIVAMAPDGRILALAGRRTTEPKGSRDGSPDWRLATDVWAPSASIFKLVTASALVSAGVQPDDKVCYHGGIRSVLEHNLRDDKRDNRCETLTYGVAHSNNAILGKLAFQKLEPKTLEAHARTFGWMSPIGSLPGLTGELAMPASHDLDFAKTAAGFSSEAGGAKLSVLGGALIAATFARDGEQPVARLIESIDGTPVATPGARRVVTADTARAVAQMMVQTCEGGSAVKSFGKRKVRVAGKTGTLTKKAPFYMEHSWFVGFAPVERPEIVVSVLFGNPESWHLRGHEAARRLIDHATKVNARGREKDRTSLREPKRPPS